MYTYIRMTMRLLQKHEGWTDPSSRYNGGDKRCAIIYGVDGARIYTIYQNMEDTVHEIFLLLFSNEEINNVGQACRLPLTELAT